MEAKTEDKPESPRRSKVFNQPSEDTFALISSDKIAFYVSRAALCGGSSVFRDMLSLPPPPPSAAATSESEEASAKLSENRHLLESFLLVFLGRGPPRVTTLNGVLDLALMATKYDAPTVLLALRAELRNFALTDPLKAFAIAARFDWEREAGAISGITHDCNVQTMQAGDVEHTPTVYYHLLTVLHQQRREKTQDIICESKLNTAGMVLSKREKTLLVRWWQGIRSKLLGELDPRCASSVTITPWHLLDESFMPREQVVSQKQYDLIMFNAQQLATKLENGVPNTIWDVKTAN